MAGTVTTTSECQFPGDETLSHDLDPTNGSGDLVIDVPVGYAQAVVIAAKTLDGNDWSASVKWVDGDGNEFRTQSAADINLSGVQDDDARLFRKGPRCEVTFTSDVANGTQNRINAFVGAHR